MFFEMAQEDLVDIKQKTDGVFWGLCWNVEMVSDY